MSAPTAVTSADITVRGSGSARSLGLGFAFGSAGGQVAVEQREHWQVFGAACGFLGPDDVG